MDDPQSSKSVQYIGKSCHDNHELLDDYLQSASETAREAYEKAYAESKRNPATAYDKQAQASTAYYAYEDTVKPIMKMQQDHLDSHLGKMEDGVRFCRLHDEPDCPFSKAVESVINRAATTLPEYGSEVSGIAISASIEDKKVDGLSEQDDGRAVSMETQDQETLKPED